MKKTLTAIILLLCTVVPVVAIYVHEYARTSDITHGFAIPELNIDAGEIKAGHNVVVEFTPTKTGSYQFYCTTWCGEHHMQMKGDLEIVSQ